MIRQTESLQRSSLAKEIDVIAKGTDFSGKFEVQPVTAEMVPRLRSRGIPMDLRVRTKEENGYASVSEGLDFDSQRVRTQAFAIFARTEKEEEEEPIGVMTFVIAPKDWIEKQQYFLREKGSVRVVGAKAITKGESADYFVIPGWTYLSPEYRHRPGLLRPGLTTFIKIMQKINEVAPPNTWVVMTPQGTYPLERSKQLRKTIIEHKDVAPWKADFTKQIGEISKGSRTTLNVAKQLGLSLKPNIGSSFSLGPVLAEKIEDLNWGAFSRFQEK